MFFKTQRETFNSVNIIESECSHNKNYLERIMSSLNSDEWMSEFIIQSKIRMGLFFSRIKGRGREKQNKFTLDYEQIIMFRKVYSSFYLDI